MYPSRLVVRNPGGLFGPVAEGELGTEGVTSSRNPVLSALLQEVQLPDSDRVICENRGTGIPTMLEQLRRSGTASVKFSNAISHFTVTFTRDEPSGDESRTGRDPSRAGGNLAGRPAQILALFTGSRNLAAADIALVDHHDCAVFAGQQVRGGQPCDARADDADVGVGVTSQRGVRGEDDAVRPERRGCAMIHVAS